MEALDDPEDREDLIDHLKAMKRYREGTDKGTPWEEVKRKLELGYGIVPTYLLAPQGKDPAGFTRTLLITDALSNE